MGKYRDVLGQILRLTVIMAVCVAVMFGVYAALGRFGEKVLIGGLVGGVLAVGHFAVLSLTIARAIARATGEKETARVQLAVQTSAGIRLLVIAVILILLFRAGICDPLAALIPLLIAQFAIKLIDLFRAGKGADQP